MKRILALLSLVAASACSSSSSSGKPSAPPAKFGDAAVLDQQDNKTVLVWFALLDRAGNPTKADGRVEFKLQQKNAYGGQLVACPLVFDVEASDFRVSTEDSRRLKKGSPIWVKIIPKSSCLFVADEGRPRLESLVEFTPTKGEAIEFTGATVIWPK